MWVAHLEENGFKVVTKDVADITGIKRTHDVPPMISSCHTALVGGMSSRDTSRPTTSSDS